MGSNKGIIRKIRIIRKTRIIKTRTITKRLITKTDKTTLIEQNLRIRRIKQIKQNSNKSLIF
jgi:hypothetical protein